MQRRVLNRMITVPLRPLSLSVPLRPLSLSVRRPSSLSFSLVQSRRCLSTGAQQEGGSGSDGKKEAGEEVPFDEPLVARISRGIWKAIKVTIGTLIAGGILYCGYSIVLVLVPVGSSSNRIMRKASDILEHDPDITKYFGSVKTFGIGAGEGRRYYVPEYKYDDALTGVG